MGELPEIAATLCHIRGSILMLQRFNRLWVFDASKQSNTFGMGSNSKVLLDLEANDSSNSSTSCLESKLQFCNKDNAFLQSGTTKPNSTDQKPPIFTVRKSHVLGKVKDFLGVISESNRSLMQEAKDNPDHYDIEVLSGRESEYIEMDLMLGVTDLHTPEAIAAAECAIAGHQPVITFASNNSSSESGDSSDDDDDDDDDDDAEENNDIKDKEDDDQVSCHSAKIISESAEKDSSKASRNQKSRKRQKIVELS